MCRTQSFYAFLTKVYMFIRDVLLLNTGNTAPWVCRRYHSNHFNKLDWSSLDHHRREALFFIFYFLQCFFPRSLLLPGRRRVIPHTNKGTFDDYPLSLYPVFQSPSHLIHLIDLMSDCESAKELIN